MFASSMEPVVAKPDCRLAWRFCVRTSETLHRRVPVMPVG
jgi:hypothetical protein